MKLSVLERLKLLAVLPAEGSFLTLRIVRQLREALSFTEAEFAAFEMTEADGRATWKRSEDRAFDFKPRALALILDTLKRLDAEGKLSLDLLSLAEKFLAAAPDEPVVERGAESEDGLSPARNGAALAAVKD